MIIRNASESDLEAIVKIYNQAIAEGQRTGDTAPVSLENRTIWFYEHHPSTHPILVAEMEQHVVGFLSLSPYRPGRMALRHTAEVSYYIDYAHHRQSIASKLLVHAMALCPTLQIKSLLAIIMATNTASTQLLEKYGFAKWGLLPNVADFNGTEVSHVFYGIRVY